MIERVVERFCNSVSDATYWVLIIACVGWALIWVLKQIALTDFPTVKKRDEEE